MKPVLYRYRDSESVIKHMDGYTPGEGWEPLYSQDQVDQLQAQLVRQQKSYEAEIKVESEERLQNCAALVAEVERLRAAPATAPEPVAWLAHYVGRSGMEQEYVATDKNLADENDASGKALPLYLHPPATAPAQPEIVDLLAEMYELILANKVVLAEKSGGVWTWPDRAIEAVRKHRSGPARAQADHKKSV
jgi:hypothetical protein